MSVYLYLDKNCEEHVSIDLFISEGIGYFKFSDVNLLSLAHSMSVSEVCIAVSENAM